MKFRLLFISLLLVPVFLSAQLLSPAEEFEKLLNTKIVTYAQASRFVLEAAEVMIVSDPNEAFRYAVNQGWLPKRAGPGDLAKLNHISRLLMRSFDAKGGLFYSMTKGSRYSYHELKYMNVVQGRVDATMYVSGERLIFYVNRLLARPEIKDTLEKRRIANEKLRVWIDTAYIELSDIVESRAMASAFVQMTYRGVLLTLNDSHVGSVVNPNNEMGSLQEIVRILSTIPDIRVLVVGQTSAGGTDVYLFGLSNEKARSVADLLVSLGAIETNDVAINGDRR